MDSDARAITQLFETVSLGAPQNAVGFVMWRVVHRYQREVEQALRALDLTHLQFVTLSLVAWMGRGGEAVTQSDLARFGDIHPMQVSNVLKALEQKGMVQRGLSRCWDVAARDPCWPVSCSHAGRTAPRVERLGPEMPMRPG